MRMESLISHICFTNNYFQSDLFSWKKSFALKHIQQFLELCYLKTIIFCE